MAWMWLLLLSSIAIHGGEAQPVFGTYGDWSDWSNCNPDCGLGTQTRTRVCSQIPCIGDSDETKSCSTSCGCNLNPCTNGGTCIQNVNDPKEYTCACALNYYGNNSQSCTEHINSNDPINGESIVSILQRVKWLVESTSGKNIQLTLTPFNLDAGNISENMCTNVNNDIASYISAKGLGTPTLTTQEVTRCCPCIYTMLIVTPGNTTDILNADIFCNDKMPPTYKTYDSTVVSIEFRTYRTSVQNVNGISFSFTSAEVDPSTTTSDSTFTSDTSNQGNCDSNGSNCLHGSTCIDETISTYRCSCTPEYTGTHCETPFGSSTKYILPIVLSIIITAALILGFLYFCICKKQSKIKQKNGLGDEKKAPLTGEQETLPNYKYEKEKSTISAVHHDPESHVGIALDPEVLNTGSPEPPHSTAMTKHA